MRPLFKVYHKFLVMLSIFDDSLCRNELQLQLVEVDSLMLHAPIDTVQRDSISTAPCRLPRPNNT